ncbi:Na+/H+ antiporter subunit E [Dethiobacter alkaliphilus]|uniref:Na+/H+ antiporter subunit E n=1 Tax=Dethiobacter alkaliphilus TaxID=427926 RepID=UPI002226E60C|nr:Na+/H+ antiporter subunit E [Dethiobacter alkaliphilus]MCW3491367.1 Na+/H+ antiporter subunit E [Dethiobacter alkaliphilus]
MSKNKYGATFWVMVGILFIFWILITWRVNWQHLLIGALCSYGIARFNHDLLLKPEERPLYHKATIGRWIKYFYILVVEIFKANWDVARIVLNPKLDISPGFVKYRTEVKKPLNRVILANSITLTPGTLTVEVEEGIFYVHAITRQNAEDVATWDMQDKLTEIEELEKHVS